MLGNQVDISLELLKFKSLKSVYVDVETRAKYREKILEGGKFANMVLIRCEPSKFTNIIKAPCFDIKVSKNTDVRCLSGKIRSCLESINPSIYLFYNGNLCTEFSTKIGTYWEQHKQEDGILYLEYSDLNYSGS